MESRRPTQQDVAREAGVHRTTVSMALNRHPNIPADTRERILAAAKKLGYAPDPMLSALAAYRSRHRPAAFQGALAWIVNSAHGFNWKNHGHFVDYHRGANARARFHGFKLELFDVNAPGLNPERVASILRTRHIPGLLLCPQPRPDTHLEFPWEEFSALTFGYTLTQPRLAAVAPTHYQASLETVRVLLRRGYKRIGLALHQIHDQRTFHNYLAGYLVGLQLAGLPQDIPPLGAEYGDIQALGDWLGRHRPDAVLCGTQDFLETLHKLHLSAPADLGVACPALYSAETRLSGFVENGQRMGEVAVDALVSMIHRGERGVPATAERILVEGRWHEGGTLVPEQAS